MRWTLRPSTLERSIVQDKNFLYTIISFSTILVVFFNLTSFHYPLIGVIASIIFFVINTVFLGNAFFEKEPLFFRFVFGMLLFIMLLGFVGWLTLIIYNLDATRVTLVLLVVATSSSLLNRRMKHRHATS